MKLGSRQLTGIFQSNFDTPPDRDAHLFYSFFPFFPNIQITSNTYTINPRSMNPSPQAGCPFVFNMNPIIITIPGTINTIMFNNTNSFSTISMHLNDQYEDDLKTFRVSLSAIFDTPLGRDAHLSYSSLVKLC